MLRTPVVALVLLLIPSFCLAAACPELSVGSARERLERLGAEIRHHDRLYYQELRPVVGDAEYDRLFAELVRLEECFPALVAPDSPTRRVGGGLDGRTPKVAHARPMLSLSSAAGPEAVEALLHRAPKAAEAVLLVQPKVDGLPVELVYEGGRLVSAATRGDGLRGEEVTARVRQVRGIPLELAGVFPPRVVVRGEVYADRQAMAAGGGGQYATPRHLAAAALRAQDPDPGALAVLRLFPFEMVDAEGVDTDQAALRLLAAWGLPVAAGHTHLARDLAEVRAVYREYLESRDRQPFAMDGIVVKLDELVLRRRLGEGPRAPLWAAAWKFPPATARTEVRAIRWSVGRTGRRTPVAELKPVELGGVQVRRLSLHSAAEVDRLGLAAGDEVVVALSGDVVPQLVAVVGKEPGAAFGPPAATPEPAVDACLEDAPGCREQFLARAVHFASKAGLDIAGLGRGRLRRLVEAGLVTDLPSLLRLREAEIAAVPGFGERSARQLTAAIGAAGRPELPRLLAALGIPGVGKSTASRLGEEFSTLADLLAAEEAQLAAVPGVGPAAAGNLRAFFGSSGGRRLLAGLRELGMTEAGPAAE